MLIYSRPIGDIDLNAFLTTAGSIAAQLPKVGDYAKEVCSIATGTPVQAGTAWASSQLNPSQASILNQSAGYANSVCKGAVAATAAPGVKLSTFKLPPAIAAKAVASTAAYPAGTIYAYDAKAGGYRVAVPIGTQMSGLGVPTHMQQAIALQKPTSTNAREVSSVAYQDAVGEKPFYKTTLGLVAIGVGGVALLGTGILLARRSRAPASPAAVAGLAGSPYEHTSKVAKDLDNVSAAATDAARLLQVGACGHAWDSLQQANEWAGHLSAEWWWATRDPHTTTRVDKARKTVGILNKTFERRCVHLGPPASWEPKGQRQRAPTVKF
jgi:hypothetical protein